MVSMAVLLGNYVAWLEKYSFPYGKIYSFKIFKIFKIFSLFVPCNMAAVQKFPIVRCEIDNLIRLRQLHLSFRRIVSIQHGSRNQISSEGVSATGGEEKNIPQARDIL